MKLERSSLPAPSKANPSSECRFPSPPITLFIIQITLTQQHSSNEAQDIPLYCVLSKIHELELLENFALIKTTLRFHLTPVRMAKIKNSSDSRCWQGCGEEEHSPIAGGIASLYNHSENPYGSSSEN
jgi:hypothetical protein